MKRLINQVVESCSNCQHHETIEYPFGGLEYDYCNKAKKEVHYTMYVDGFPEWCPLKIIE